MGLFNILDPVLDFSLAWSLQYPSLGLILLSLGITVIITLIYKHTTNQESLKHIKTEQKKLQKELRTARGDPKKAMKLNSKLMSLNKDYMGQSLKSMMYTFLPIIILLGWLVGHFSYMPLEENTPFNISLTLKNEISNVEMFDSADLVLLSNSSFENPSGEVFWTLKGPPGKHIISLKVGSKVLTKEVVINEGQQYINPVRARGSFMYVVYGPREDPLSKDSVVSKILVSNKKFKPLDPYSILGWHPGWLGTYIIFSIFFSIIVRKILGVH